MVTSSFKFIAKVKRSATILYVQIFFDVIFIPSLKNAFLHLQMFRHTVSQTAFHFESTHLLSQKKKIKK